MLNKKLVREWKKLFLQALMIILISTIGISMFVASYTAFLSLESSYDFTYKTLNYADVQIITTKESSQYVDQIKSILGVNEVASREITSMPISIGSKEFLGKIEARLMGIREDEVSVNKVQVIKGEELPISGNYILVERHFAEAHEIEPGDSIILNGYDTQIKCVVSGIVSSPEYLWVAKSRSEIMPSPNEFGVLFLRQEVLDKIDYKQSYFDIVFTAEDPYLILEEVKEILEPLNIMDTVMKEDQISYNLLKMDLGGFRELAYTFPVIFLSVSGFIIFILLTKLVENQRGIIGTLRALGFSKKEIRNHYLKFSLMISVFGGIFGIGIGFAFGNIVFELYKERIGLPFGENVMSPMVFLAGFLFSLILGGLSGYFPARKAANLLPVEAMRSVPSSKDSKTYKWLNRRMNKILIKLPLTYRMTLRNMYKHLTRYILTIIGISVSISLVMTTAGLLDSVRYMMNQQFDIIEGYDLTVIFQKPVQSTAFSTIANLDGVVGVEGVFDIPVTVKKDGESIQTILRGIAYHDRLYKVYENVGFFNIASIPLEIPQDGVLVSKSLQRALGLELGSEIVVESALYEKNISYKIEGIINLPLGSMIIQKDEGLVNMVDNYNDEYNKIFIKLDGNSNQVKTQIESMFDGAVVQEQSNTRALINEFMGLFVLFILVMFVFAAILSSAVLFSVIFINVIERKNEIATLRSLGYSNKQVRKLFELEHFVISLMSLMFSVVFSIQGMFAVSTLYSNDMFTLPIYVSSTTVAWTFGVFIFIIFVARGISQHTLNKINIAEAIKQLDA